MPTPPPGRPADSSAHRLLAILLEERLVVLDRESQTYHPVTRIASWAVHAFGGSNLPNRATALMEGLHERTGALVLLSILDGSSVLILKNIGWYDPYRHVTGIGEHCPVHVCAAGKAILAFLPDERREEIISRIELTSFTEHIVKTRQAFEKQLAQVRKTGLATCDREDFLQYAAISAPVFGIGGAVVAALSLWNTIDRQSIKQLLDFERELLSTTKTLSDRLGAES